jgi:GGDEF domain-containing protein
VQTCTTCTRGCRLRAQGYGDAGPGAGDAVLREIAYRWRAALRAYGLASAGSLGTQYGRADAALYAAKRAGRDRVCVHEG